MRTARRVLSPIGVLLAFAWGAWFLRWLTAGSWSGVRDGNPSFEALLVFVVAVLAWACYAWLAFGTILMALSVLPGALGRACGELAERVTPAAYRRIARIALGISVAAGPMFGALPANAATVDQPTQAAAAAAQMLPSLDRPGTIDSRLPSGVTLPSLDRPSGSDVVTSDVVASDIVARLPMPDRPVADQAPVTGQADLPNPERPQTSDPVTRAPVRDLGDVQQQVVVKRGDTLWDIAARHLGPGASNAEIHREWQRWYEANRQVIGDDPNLILPGQILTPPPPQR
ncbi:LysM peptidoglycan-binding domain-containing protein [Thermasporomyces composti]|jgi:nucleoid-associated protein YgaU|uniref:LysM domain-containing protein n=1 Tax=Thermasporomyces composti TaxID=696763 RepID=A0A3D9V8C7_THECX|nr:LysM peptidoglycan-binding domain-containing protein [Thermasporomyces composti]REF37546.1 LysM domain-containing protein [Thermasporomyces composti]